MFWTLHLAESVKSDMDPGEGKNQRSQKQRPPKSRPAPLVHVYMVRLIFLRFCMFTGVAQH